MSKNAVILLITTIPLFATCQHSGSSNAKKKPGDPQNEIPSLQRPNPDTNPEEPEKATDIETEPETNEETETPEVPNEEEEPLPPNSESAETFLKVDYQACSNQNLQGVQHYNSTPQCPDYSIITIINDGIKPLMTCCPVDPNLFANSEVHERKTRCGPQEVAVGMNGNGASVLCRVIDTETFNLSPETAISYLFAPHDLAADDPRKPIIAAYDTNDVCACEAHHVYIGNHINEDDVCTDSCVKILRKPIDSN